ncbi:MAG TPA: hypothetical protein PKO23_19085 [Candidatus Hydrogenedentes bacterium]|nr:hypothetical protein [Candidatus Hydrogenedentota bacterium]
MIRYQNPGDAPLSLLVKAIPSRLLHSLAYRIDNRHGIPTVENTVENIVEQQGLAFPLFRQAVEVTDRLFAMIRARCGSVPLVAFNPDAREPYATAFNAICAKHGLTEIQDIPRAIEAAAREGIHVFAEDGLHWNSAGHTICGKLLAETLRPLCGG